MKMRKSSAPTSAAKVAIQRMPNSITSSATASCGWPIPFSSVGQEISRSGLIKDVDRRTELANMIIASPYMSRAIVNRMWGHFMGYGFTKPVDDMGPHNPPTNPELLDRLAADFAVHQYATDGYDLKQLMRWIVLSEPYGLSARIMPGNKSDDPMLGEKPQFSHFYLRQMSAEELYESLLTATSADKTRGSSDEQEKAKQEWLQQFVINFGTDDGGETTTFNGTIPQTLMMFNGYADEGERPRAEKEEACWMWWPIIRGLFA